MVIDPSAILAILLQEPDAATYVGAIAADAVRLLSAVSALEAAVEIESRKGLSGGRDLDLLLHTAQMEIVPFTSEHYELARRAYKTYGKGRHPAALNLGDCCTYALAKFSGEPVLAKGSDFRQTDVIVLPSLLGSPNSREG